MDIFGACVACQLHRLLHELAEKQQQTYGQPQIHRCQQAAAGEDSTLDRARQL
jgi:hypothetical protein